MDEPRLLIPGGGADTPGGHVRLALLATLLTLIATAVPFLGVYRPPPVHRVAVDLRDLPCGGPVADYHRLDIGMHGGLTFDGEPQADLSRLRRRLDRLLVEPEQRVMLNPHPETRYEVMLEVLAVMRRASVYRVRLACAGEPIRHPGETGRTRIDAMEVTVPVPGMPIKR